jgi:hypothetical protein
VFVTMVFRHPKSEHGDDFLGLCTANGPNRRNTAIEIDRVACPSADVKVAAG